MKLQILLKYLCFVLLLTSSLYGVARETGEEEKTTLSSKNFYREGSGIVDAIYPKESRIIINDISFFYTSKTQFQNSYGSTVLKLQDTLKPGTPIKYFYRQQSKHLVLTAIKVISKNELEKSRRIMEDY